MVQGLRFRGKAQTFVPAQSSIAASPHAVPTATVWTGGFTYPIVSKMANASVS